MIGKPPILLAFALGLGLLAGCAEIGVVGPTVCEDWVKTQIANPESYSWSSSQWAQNGPDVSLHFTAAEDGMAIDYIAECHFVDPDVDDLRIDPERSEIHKFDF